MKLDMTPEEAKRAAENLKKIRYWFKGYNAAREGEQADIGVFHLASLLKLQLALEHATSKEEKKSK